tara:strand:+ start:2187 stop:2966 length:780 start_codon:yes stop_codon:yes gene_type:complete
MTKNHFNFAKGDMKRYLAKLAAHSGKKTNESILHFESFNDASLVENMIKKYRRDKNSDKIRYMFTKGKNKAIKNHKKTIAMGHNISTIVDMDHDLNHRDFFISKKSKERLSRLYSTKPACTLLTIPYSDNGIHNHENFSKAVKTIPNLKDASNELILEIKNDAVKKTWARLKSGIWAERYKKKIEADFAKEKIFDPLNDHSMIEAIIEKNTNLQEKDIEMIKTQLEKFILSNNSNFLELVDLVLLDFKFIDKNTKKANS